MLHWLLATMVHTSSQSRGWACTNISKMNRYKPHHGSCMDGFYRHETMRTSECTLACEHDQQCGFAASLTNGSCYHYDRYPRHCNPSSVLRGYVVQYEKEELGEVCPSRSVRLSSCHSLHPDNATVAADVTNAMCHTVMRHVSNVALVITGQLRIFTRVFDTLHRNLLLSLAPDVYVHASNRVAYSNGPPPNGEPIENTALSCPKLRLLMPKLLACWIDSVDEQAELVRRWQVAYHWMVSAERATGKEYEWVIRTRPDLEYHCTFTLPYLMHTTANGTLVVSVWDFIDFIPRSLAMLRLNVASASITAGHR